jgi:hypothetical protein
LSGDDRDGGGKRLRDEPRREDPSATPYSAILKELRIKGADSRFVKTGRGQFARAAVLPRPPVLPPRKPRAGPPATSGPGPHARPATRLEPTSANGSAFPGAGDSALRGHCPRSTNTIRPCSPLQNPRQTPRNPRRIALSFASRSCSVSSRLNRKIAPSKEHDHDAIDRGGGRRRAPTDHR